ncbi:fasciclin domain-containing protein [Flavobacterium sp.]|uniref:fasciclin domain-containing protein n=1 Tax=Flavobacterium sp. TaxID=239 RepID=UPI00286CCF0B|nr:fasciclin domain-containing protein [Flavobacterium sp.]
MKIIAKLNKIALLAIIAVATFSCNNDDPIVNPTPVDNSIAGIASRNADLSVLVKALTKTDLATTVAGSGSFTVFAPTNAAFAKINITAASIDALTPAQIPGFKQIVLNHVSAGAKSSTQLVDKAYIKTLATFSTTTSNLSMFVDKTSGVKLNGLATVTTANILATNGVIHVVDEVLVLPTIVSHAIANPALDTLQAVVTSATGGAFGDQTAILAALNSATASAPFTVFAPTNAAFATATGTGGFANGATPAQVSNVLLYHVFTGGNVLAASLTEGQVVTTAFNNQTFSVTLVGGAQITDKSTPIGAVKAKIIITDIQASNGVVHAVDKVLQPTL